MKLLLTSSKRRRACIILIRESISQYWTFLITVVVASDAFRVPIATEPSESGSGAKRRSGGMIEFWPQAETKDMEPATTWSS